MGVDKSTQGLNKLLNLAAFAKNTSKASRENILPELPTANDSNTGSKVSRFSALAKSRNLTGKASLSGLASPDPHSQTSSIPNLAQRFKLAKKANTKEPAPPTEAKPQELQPNKTDLSKHDQNLRKRQKRDLDLHMATETCGYLNTPLHHVSLYLFQSIPPSPSHKEYETIRNQNCHRLFYAYTNHEVNIAKAKANFSQPSPDDKIVESQKRAFEQSLENLKIAPDAKEKAPQKYTETKPFKHVDLHQEFTLNKLFTKNHKSFVIIGHVDAGKSTLMGRILFDTGTVDAKTVNKLVREAEKSGKGSFALAWIMDQTSEERSRGVTIDICATSFETALTRFTAIDAPGHKDFVPQMISGVSQADMALLVVDAINGEFEAGFVMKGQTKEHTILAKSLGVNKLCVAINKLDKEQWSQSRFEDIKEQLTQFLTSDEVSYSREDLYFVPVSGLNGCNVLKRDASISELPWYQGPALIECLELIVVAGSKFGSIEELNQREFVLAINDIYDVTSSEFKVKGKILLGMIQPGQTVVTHPTDDNLQVQSVTIDGVASKFAIEGQIAQLVFKINQLKHNNTDELSVGDILLSHKSSVQSTNLFHANLNMFGMEKPLMVGTPFVMFRNNASCAARISKVSKINGLKKKKMHLVSKQTADVVIEILSEKPLPIAKFDDNKSLGRVVVRREGQTIGAGMVTKIVPPNAEA